MSTLREAAQQALEAPGCSRLREWASIGPVQRAAVESFLQAALAQQEQEPVAEVVSRPERTGFGRVEDRKDVLFLADLPVGTMLYTHPPRREWQSLPACEDKPHAVLVEGYGYVDVRAVRAVEQALKERNT